MVVYTYGDGTWADLLTSYEGTDITYDAMGNPTSYYNGNKTYSMVWENGRQANMMFCDGKYKVFKYNADGIRTQKTVSSSYTEDYRLDGDRVVELVRKYNSGDTYRLAFAYDESGNPFSVDYYLGAGDTTPDTYYYVLNLQGDVIQILNENYVAVANYTYDAWGKPVAVYDANNANITISTHIANLNPFRYRGYIYDQETGFYYCNSRYYDPGMRRFINADGYVTTGQGFTSYNMYAYCGNNPVNLIDSSGQFFVSAIIVGGIILGGAFLLNSCSADSEQKPEPEPYKSADEAANAFSEEVYSSSSYIRHEYSTEIYSRTIDGETTYNYNPPRSGQPHSVTVGYSTPKGTETVAYAHTHPNSNYFSKKDINVAKNLNINAYVVGPNLKLQRYDLSTGRISNVCVISPVSLTDAQRASLVTEFQVSWDNHVKTGCDFGCKYMLWPTSYR